MIKIIKFPRKADPPLAENKIHKIMDQPNQNKNIQPQMQPDAARNQKHFKAFWPIVLISTLSAVIGGLIVWAAFNAGLDEELNSLLPGADRNIARQHKNFELQPMTSQANEPTADWQTYRNEGFGFEINLTEAWKGYKVFVSSGSQGVGAPTYIDFSMPTADNSSFVTSGTDQVYGYSAIFEITVIAKDRQYQGTGIKITEDKDNIYYYTINGIPTDLKSINFEIPKIISTFKFTK